MSYENVLKGQWKQIKGDLQKRWGQLTNDELDQVEGDSTKLEGLMQKKLGMQQEHARTELNKFMEGWNNDHPADGRQTERDF